MASNLPASNLPASNLPASNLPACHVEGIKLIKASMSPLQMCHCFQTRLAKDVGSDTDLTDIRIILRTKSAHKVEASISRVSDDHSDVFAQMAIKVHDRPINSSDIQSLATVAALHATKKMMTSSRSKSLLQ